MASWKSGKNASHVPIKLCKWSETSFPSNIGTPFDRFVVKLCTEAKWKSASKFFLVPPFVLRISEEEKKVECFTQTLGRHWSIVLSHATLLWAVSSSQHSHHHCRVRTEEQTLLFGNNNKRSHSCLQWKKVPRPKPTQSRLDCISQQRQSSATAAAAALSSEAPEDGIVDDGRCVSTGTSKLWHFFSSLYFLVCIEMDARCSWTIFLHCFFFGRATIRWS